MKAPLLLDTCAIIWTVGGDAISTKATEALKLATQNNLPVQVSPISAWEIGLLVSKGRLSIAGRAQNWFAQVLELPGMAAAKMPHDILIESWFLPGAPPNDPADRVIITTAREYGLCILTRDRAILTYASAGHVQALEC